MVVCAHMSGRRDDNPATVVLPAMLATMVATDLQMALADRLLFPHHKRLAEAGRTLETPAFTWPSVERQGISHRAVLGFYDGGSVLDLGCGMGELSEKVSGRYVGIDLELSFIEQARTRYPRREFRCGSLESAPPGSFDYVMAIGPLCYVQGGSYEEDMGRFRALLRTMLECSRVAALATVSSDLANAIFQGERPELRFSSPSFWFAYASQLSRRIVLKHDYVASEFVLAVFRESTDWPRR